MTSAVFDKDNTLWVGAKNEKTQKGKIYKKLANQDKFIKVTTISGRVWKLVFDKSNNLYAVITRVDGENDTYFSHKNNDRDDFTTEIANLGDVFVVETNQKDVLWFAAEKIWYEGKIYKKQI